MYLSHLMIEVGSDPDRPRPGRLWLRNMYHVHQRLCMAFLPSDSKKKKDDPEFLKPFSPDDFPETRQIADQKPEAVGAEALKHVHRPRDSESGFLFRVDPLPGASAAILVLSATQPDWDYAFHNADYLLAAPPSEPRRLKVSIVPGARFQFRLAANPVRKVTGKSRNAKGEPFDEKWIGKHVPVPADEASLRDWLERRAEPRWSAARNSEDKQHPPGFRLVEITGIQTGYVYFNKTRDAAKGQRLRSARFEGILEVSNPDDFRKTLICGIGPAKAFGFGLLSVAPL